MKCKLLIGILFAFVCFACKKNETTDIDNDNELRDSTALYVAIFPSEGCLPIYYAEENGLFKDKGLNIRIMHLNTMEDCDTALTNHRAEVAATDIARLLCMRKDNFEAKAIGQIKGELQLLTAKGKRITATKQLKERIVAMDRHSTADYCSDRILDGTNIDQLEIYRTQFNNHKVRCDMLTDALVDAALLDEPYATYATELGAKVIWKSDSTQQSWAILAAPTDILADTLRAKQISQFMDVYQQAVEQLKKGEKSASVKQIITRYYTIPETSDAVNTVLTSTQYQPIAPVLPETVKRAKEWLIGRGWITTRTIQDDSSLIYNK